MAFNEHDQQLTDAIASIKALKDILYDIVHGDETFTFVNDSGITLRGLANILDLSEAIENILVNGTSEIGIYTEDGPIDANTDLNVDGNLDVTGQIDAVNLVITTLATLASANITGAVNAGSVTATGDVDGDNLIATADVSGDTATIGTSATVNGSNVLTEANEGSGNGIDADTVDGIEGAKFVRSDVADQINGILTFLANPKINPSSGDAVLEITSEDNDAIIRVTSNDTSPGGFPSIELIRGNISPPEVIVIEMTGNEELTITGVGSDSFKLGTAKILTDENLPAATQASQETGTATDEIVTPENQKFNRSAAKAWVNFNGTGTVAIRDSENVSSITDNGTGDYTINFTNNFANTDYVFTGTTRSDSDSTINQYGGIVTAKLNGSKLVSSIDITTPRCDNADVIDLPEVNVVFFGDLA